MTSGNHEAFIRPSRTNVPIALRFGVSEWAAATPDIETREAWAAWSRSGVPLPRSEAAVSGAALPATLRRRLDRMGRLVMQVLFAIDARSDDGLVFASRFGELAKSFDLLRQLHAEQLPSPTTFALSVHNALAGQAAIALGNRLTHSAVAAGADTFSAGLIEAVTCARRSPGGSCVLIYYDAPPPDEVGAAADEGPLFAIALRISASPAEADAITLATDDATTGRPARGAAEAVLHFLADPGAGRAVWQGQRSDWSLTRAA